MSNPSDISGRVGGSLITYDYKTKELKIYDGTNTIEFLDAGPTKLSEFVSILQQCKNSATKFADPSSSRPAITFTNWRVGASGTLAENGAYLATTAAPNKIAKGIFGFAFAPVGNVNVKGTATCATDSDNEATIADFNVDLEPGVSSFEIPFTYVVGDAGSRAGAMEFTFNFEMNGQAQTALVAKVYFIEYGCVVTVPTPLTRVKGANPSYTLTNALHCVPEDMFRAAFTITTVFDNDAFTTPVITVPVRTTDVAFNKDLVLTGDFSSAGVFPYTITIASAFGTSYTVTGDFTITEA